MKSANKMRVFGMAAVATAALGTVIGSGSVSASTSNHITLTMWQQWGGGHEEATLKKIIKQYEQLHPNVTINELPVTENSKILTAISGGNPPDIIDLSSSMTIGEWASKGALTNLTPYIQKDKSFKLSSYVKSGLDSVAYKGSLYGLPFMNFDAALIYNKKLFQEAGIKNPPRTLEELTKDAFKLTKVGPGGRILQEGFIPNYPPSGNSIETYGWLFGGGWYNNSNVKVTANNPKNVAALTWEKQFYDKFGAQNVSNFVKSAGAYLTPQDPFQSGKIAMTFDGSWVIAYAEANNPSLAKDIGVVPLPAQVGNASRSGTTYIDTNPQVIPAGSKNAGAAWDFISWETTNVALAREFATLTANFPQLKSVPNFKLASDPLYKVYINETKSSNAHAWPQTSVSDTYFSKLAQVEDGVLQGNQVPAQALAQLNSDITSATSGQ